MVKLNIALVALFSFVSASAWSPQMTMKVDTNTNVASSRRSLLGKGIAAAGTLAVPSLTSAYTLPDLPYPYESLEPFIDAPTMKFHHDKHHATYIANVNKATEGKDEVPILDLMADALEAGPGIRNSGGGHYNHAFFWTEMAPPDEAKKSKVSDKLDALITKSFGSMEEMKSKFEAAGAPGAVFGSGWVWVCLDGDELKIVGTANQDNPLMKGVTSNIMYPILGIDVWEHAYYLKYQNRRPEYISNWWNVVNWNKVSENLDYVMENKAGVPF